MTVSKLILHHNYSGGVAFDLSGNGNHGTLENVSIAGGNVQFSGGPQVVRVKPSKTLTALRGVRAQVQFQAAPFATAPFHHSPGEIIRDHRTPHPETLIEGYESFAFLLNPDGSLEGKINAKGVGWVGAKSPPSTVAANQSYIGTFLHDGFATCKIYLDGNVVAVNDDALGPVTAVAPPYGLAIGHAPIPDDEFTFRGEISETKVWTDDPDPRHFFDECCIDRDGLDDAIATLRALGEENGQDMSAAGLGAVVGTVLDLGHRVAGRASAGSQANRDQVRHLTEQGMLAFSVGDQQALFVALHGMSQVLDARVSAGEVTADWNALLGALDATPIGPAMRQAIADAEQGKVSPSPDTFGLAKLMCLDWMAPQPPTRGVKPRAKPTEGPRRPTSDIPDDWGDDADRHDDPPPYDGDRLPPGPDWNAWELWASQHESGHDGGGPT
jgi:hypothetical protein